MKVSVNFQLVNTLDTQKTEAVELPEWAKGACLVVPAIADGAMGMEFIHNSDVTTAKLAADQDTDWNVVEVAIDSVGPLVTVLASGDDPRVVDISKFIKSLGDGYIRFTTAAQAGVIDFIIIWSD